MDLSQRAGYPRVSQSISQRAPQSRPQFMPQRRPFLSRAGTSLAQRCSLGALRAATAVLAVSGALVLFAEPAMAGCGGEPPAPPQPQATPSTGTRGPSTLGPAPATTPRETEAERRIGDRRGARTGRRLPNTSQGGGWWTWWTSQREAFVDRYAVRHAAVVTGLMPEADEEVAGDASAAAEIRAALIPTLRELTSPPQKVDRAIRLQALEALGRVDVSEFTLRRLALWLVDRRANGAERAAALRGLGNLAQAEALDDALRARLLNVLDATERNKYFEREHHTLVSLVLGYLARPARETPAPVDLNLTRLTWDRFDSPTLESSNKLALVMSLGRQHPRTVASTVRGTLTQIVIRGRFKGHTFNATARSEALRALVALDRVGAPHLIGRVLDSRRLPVELARASLDEIARITPTADEEARRVYSSILITVQRRLKDVDARGLWYIAAGTLKRHDSAEKPGELMRLLFKAARRTSSEERTFVLLALGLARHDVADVAWQAEATRLLIASRHDQDPHVRAAAVLALGLRPKVAPAATLRELALSKREDPLVRTAAMEVLSLQGAPSPEFRSALARLLDKRQDPRLEAAATRTLALIAPRVALKEIREVLTKDGSPRHEATRLYRLAQVRVLDFLRPFEVWAGDMHEQPMRRMLSIFLLTEVSGQPSPWIDLGYRVQTTPALSTLLASR